MFRTLLIANRGEIACRIIRTARRLGVETIAVYSEADARALHVQAADRAYPIGPAPARDSYLNIARIIEAARAAGAEAIHPGYGFLSENPVFAEACAAAGIVFVGPPPGAMRAMGSKSSAKALMETSAVPLLPGYHGDRQDPAFLEDQAARIGFPVVIKAVSGGGGARHAGGDLGGRFRHRAGFGAAGGGLVVRRRPCADRTLSATAAAHRGAGLRGIRRATPYISSSVTVRPSGDIRKCWRKRRHPGFPRYSGPPWAPPP